MLIFFCVSNVLLHSPKSDIYTFIACITKKKEIPALSDQGWYRNVFSVIRNSSSWRHEWNKNKTAQIIQQCTIRKIVFPTDPKTQLVSCCSIRCQGNSVGWYLAKKLVLFLLTMLLDSTTEAENDICKEPLKSS